MKILISGGNGFIARNLVEQLGSEYYIFAPTSQELDLLDTSSVFHYLKKYHFDIVIHTATYDAAPKHSMKDPAKVLNNNLRMFFNLARCKNFYSKMLYFGSGAEFSRENWFPKMKENYFDRYVPSDQYGFSKYVMNKYTQRSRNIFNLRLFAVFGKYEDYRVRFISNAACRAVLNMPILINQNVFFDFLFIDDLVKIVKWFITNKPLKKTYNICTGITNEFLSLADKIVEISGKNVEVIVKNPGLGKEYSGDNKLLINELQGFEFTPINQSVEDLYYWYESNKTNIDKDQL